MYLLIKSQIITLYITKLGTKMQYQLLHMHI